MVLCVYLSSNAGMYMSMCGVVAGEDKGLSAGMGLSVGVSMCMDMDEDESAVLGLGVFGGASVQAGRGLGLGHDVVCRRGGERVAGDWSVKGFVLRCERGRERVCVSGLEHSRG
eukprot:5558990-Pleurochrysis_carterae.AAC.2